MARRWPPNPDDEPQLDPPALVEVEECLVVGGETVGAPRARAKYAIERVCSEAMRRPVKAGFVEFAASGLSRDAFRAVVDDGRHRVDVYALVPNRSAERDYNRRALLELQLLHALSQREFGFRVPKVFGALRERGRSFS